MKFIKVSDDGYVRADRVIDIVVEKESGEFAVKIYIGDGEFLTLQPFATREDAIRHMDEIVAKLNEVDEQ